MPKTTEDSGREYSPVVDLEGFDYDMMDLDETWSSEESRKRIGVKLKSLLKGNTDCFSKVDVKALYKKGGYSYYRVIIYLRDYSWGGFMPTDKIWRDYYVEVSRKDYQISNTRPHIR